MDGLYPTVILYGSHLWAGNITKTNAEKLKRLNRLALLGFSKVHKGTPTASLETIYDVPPIHLVAMELGFSATDRILKATKVSWSGVGPRKKGHLLAIQERKPDLPNGASDLDNTFTHNWETKALISQNPAAPESRTRTEVFTDGSKMEGKTGCGLSVQQNGVEIFGGKFGLPPYTSVYQAELYAIEKALIYLDTFNIRGPVTIHTDSLSAIHALQKHEIVSHQCLQTINRINLYGTHNDLRIHWIKAHAGNPGNERADELAKAGTKLPPPCTLVKLSLKSRKLMYREHTYLSWDQEWQQASNDYKRTRVWFPKLHPTLSRQMFKLSRHDLASCVQWITGFCNLQRHKHKKNPLVSDICRLCHTDAETPEHLSFFCPRLLHLRSSIFHVWEGPPPSWTPANLIRFINAKPCADLLIDHTDYDN